MAETLPRFLRACGRKPADCTPVWFMRQAGRYMPAYRAVRERYSLLEICAHAELIVQVVLQPVQAFDLDAAILFADILLPMIPMGIQVEFTENEGPAIRNPIRSRADIDALRPVDPHAALAPVLEAVRILRGELEGRRPGGIPLIGFAGAPFTLASYLVEGGPSRNFSRTKLLMYNDPPAWHALMSHLSQVVMDYLTAQVEAGAQVIQLFDSWVGVLSPEDYRDYVFPYSHAIFEKLAQAGAAATIHFGTGTNNLLIGMAAAGGNVIGVDWRVPLDWAWQLLNYEVGLQGNLDPVVLLAERPALERHVRAVLAQTAGRPGHIFNLGHGILPETPVDNVRFVVDRVHELTQSGRSVEAQRGSR